MRTAAAQLARAAASVCLGNPGSLSLSAGGGADTCLTGNAATRSVTLFLVLRPCPPQLLLTLIISPPSPTSPPAAFQHSRRVLEPADLGLLSLVEQKLLVGQLSRQGEVFVVVLLVPLSSAGKVLGEHAGEPWRRVVGRLLDEGTVVERGRGDNALGGWEEVVCRDAEGEEDACVDPRAGEEAWVLAGVDIVEGEWKVRAGHPTGLEGGAGGIMELVERMVVAGRRQVLRWGERRERQTGELFGEAGETGQATERRAPAQRTDRSW